MTMKIELNYKGIGEMLRGKEMEAFMKAKGQEIARRAGSGYSCRTHNTGQRQAVNVYAVTGDAAQDNLENNTLLKAMR